MKQLNEKVAIVTGAGQGIGKGIAMCLAKRGVKVVCTGRREAPIQQTVAEIEEAGGQGLAMTCDSADRARGGVPVRPRLLLLLRPVRDRGRRQLHHAVARDAGKPNERRPVPSLQARSLAAVGRGAFLCETGLSPASTRLGASAL